MIKHIDKNKLVETFHIEDLCRPNGEVELLIGIDACFLFPTVVKTVGNLQLLENVFEQCIRGSFNKCHQGGEIYNAQVYHITIVPSSDDFTI